MVSAYTMPEVIALPDLDVFHSKVVEGAANVSSKQFLSTILEQNHMKFKQKSNVEILKTANKVLMLKLFFCSL